MLSSTPLLPSSAGAGDLGGDDHICDEGNDDDNESSSVGGHAASVRNGNAAKSAAHRLSTSGS